MVVPKLVPGTPYAILEISGPHVVPTCLIKDVRTGKFVRNSEGRNVQFSGNNIEEARSLATKWCLIQEDAN